MTGNERELYEKHQTLLALVGVLLHELRNPLHGATLLVEAMGMKGADVPQLRTKLRNQFAKLEAILSEAAQPVKELALEPQLQTIALRPLLDRAVEIANEGRSCEAELQVEGETSARIVADPILLERAVADLLLRALDPPPGSAPNRVLVRIETHSPSEIRVVFDDDGPALDELSQRSPFALVSGGTRLATARALAALAGGSLRMERKDSERGARFVLLLPGG